MGSGHGLIAVNAVILSNSSVAGTTARTGGTVCVILDVSQKILLRCRFDLLSVGPSGGHLYREPS